tara:strand:+ start:1477 stop:2316 length:840 start_codon:yes stop_codon:yes gene_type:complete
MKVFFSWSGTESRQVAEVLASWMSSVLQSVDTYISSQDIQKGERWGPSIIGNLAELDFGIVVLTKANLVAPWVSFEAGALSKNVGLARVVPILCDLTDSDLIKHPLAQFQYARLERTDLLELVRSVNLLSDRKLADSLLGETFQRWWPLLEEQLSRIKFKAAQQEDTTENPIASTTERIDKIESSIDEILHLLRRNENREKRYNAGRASEILRTADANWTLHTGSGGRFVNDSIDQMIEVYNSAKTKGADQKFLDNLRKQILDALEQNHRNTRDDGVKE